MSKRHSQSGVKPPHSKMGEVTMMSKRFPQTLAVLFCHVLLVSAPLRGDEKEMQLWKHVPLGELSGGFVLPAFEHVDGIRDARGNRRYPDMPVKVRWRNDEDSLWVPVDLCGDAREEVILYQPYQGKAVYIFTQADSDAR
jgi:hypothetical protein